MTKNKDFFGPDDNPDKQALRMAFLILGLLGLLLSFVL